LRIGNHADYIRECQLERAEKSPHEERCGGGHHDSLRTKTARAVGGGPANPGARGLLDRRSRAGPYHNQVAGHGLFEGDGHLPAADYFAGSVARIKSSTFSAMISSTAGRNGPG
jgi:hypothetical protein